MCLLPADERFLHYALELARAAAAFASPNPAVGCVLVQGEQILGEGAHWYDRRDHAEVAALQDAGSQGHDVRGATAYVTLEPCSHYGRTGPCAEALVTAGIARCVVATEDPNPKVRGSGLARMRAAGVHVQVAQPASDVAQAARRLNDAFAFSIQHDRPFVTLKSAVSLDGKLAPAVSERFETAPHWITGPAARAEVQTLRHSSDALLSGIGTVLADDPELTDRTGLPRRRPLLRVILDQQLRTPPSSQLARGARGNVLLVAADSAPAERAEALLQTGAEVVRVPTEGQRLDLRAVLALLARRDVRSLLLEAGSRLNGAFLQAGLVDRVVLYRGPEPLGDEAVPFAEGGPMTEALIARLSGASWQRLPHGEAEDVRVAGYLHDPWMGV